MYFENGNETPRESYSVLLPLMGSPFLILWRVYKTLQSERHHHTFTGQESNVDQCTEHQLKIRKASFSFGSAVGPCVSLDMSQFSCLADNQNLDFQVELDSLGLGGAQQSLS